MKLLKYPDALKLLEAMTICLDLVDNYYFKHCYDTSVSLLNSGDYTLVAGWAFEFELALLFALLNKFTVEKMNRDPWNSFTTAKKNIIENDKFKVSFQEVCLREIYITVPIRVLVPIRVPVTVSLFALTFPTLYRFFESEWVVPICFLPVRYQEAKVSAGETKARNFECNSIVHN